MKQIAVFFICLLALIACKEEASKEANAGFFEGVPVASSVEMDITVAAEQAECYGAVGKQKCLSISLPDGTETTLTEGISGYEHKEGTEQKMRVEQVTFDNSDPTLIPQDISLIQYRLIELR